MNVDIYLIYIMFNLSILEEFELPRKYFVSSLGCWDD